MLQRIAAPLAAVALLLAPVLARAADATVTVEVKGLVCSFCATGTLGLTRNLRTAEIVDQVLRMQALVPERRITNVVFMGMGEPLLNLQAVLEAVRTLLHPRGFALAPRRVTVSTVGIPAASHEVFPSALSGLDATEHTTGTSRRGYSPKVATLQRAYDDVAQLWGKSGMTLTPTLALGGATLRRMGYRGRIAVEAFGTGLPALAAATRVWRRFFDDEEALAAEALAFLRAAWAAGA